MVYIKQKGREVYWNVYQTICEALLYYADSGTFMAVFLSALFRCSVLSWHFKIIIRARVFCILSLSGLKILSTCFK